MGQELVADHMDSQMGKEMQLLAQIATLMHLPGGCTPVSVLKAVVGLLNTVVDTAAPGNGNVEKGPAAKHSRPQKRRRKETCKDAGVWSEKDAVPDDPLEAYERGFKPCVCTGAELTPKEAQSPSSVRLGNGGALLQHWLTPSLNLESFFARVWERRPLLVQRNSPGFYGNLLSADAIRQELQRGLQYALELDVVHYNGVEKQVHNANADGKHGTADAQLVWQRFSQGGCSLRLLHPQRWHDELWRTLAPLEAVFGCAMGCNAYLTPAGSQGFAPHYDDIDAFVLQLEGSKRWRVYMPRSAEEVLPRLSSHDFRQDDLGEPVLDTELHPGSLLYMPRGSIHQAEALPGGGHSLHVTISACQRTTWADFLAVALPRALELAAEASFELRQSLPRDAFSHLGIVHADSEHARRGELVGAAKRLLGQVFEHLPLDAAADQLAVAFLQQRLPPPPPVGRERGGPAAPCTSMLGKSLSAVRVQLAARDVARLVVEQEGPGDEEAALVYHCLANEQCRHARGCDADEPCSAEPAGEGEAEACEPGPGPASGRCVFPLEAAPVLEQLLAAPPRFGPEVNNKGMWRLPLSNIDLAGNSEGLLKQWVSTLCREGILRQ